MTHPGRRLTEICVQAMISVMEMTLAQAAQELGISVREAQRLARAGHLQVVRRIGRSVLVDDGSVMARSHSQPSRGRRWSAETVWAVMELLDTGATLRLSGSSRSRLKKRLRGMDAESFVRLAVDRATSVRMIQTRRRPEDLRSRVLLTGRSASTDPVRAKRLGLTPTVWDGIEGYVRATEIDALQERFGLVGDADGEVLLRVAQTGVEVTDSVIALDLVDRGSTRERSAGLECLEAALRRFVS